MRLGNIYYLLFLLIIPLFLFFSIMNYRSSNKWLLSFSGEKKNIRFFILQTILISLLIASFSLSLAEPEFQYPKTYFNRSNLEIVLGIDVSKSMLAEDVYFPAQAKKLFTIPNRLNSSRYFALDILSSLHGEKIGAYMFASKGIEIIPFTTDYSYCMYILKHIKDSDITIPGSDIGEAIKTGISMIGNSDFHGVKVMILISDGEDISMDKSSLYESARLAASHGIRIYTAGIGSGNDVLIPIRNEGMEGISSYYINEDGSYIKTSLTEETLKNISNITGGEYVRVDNEKALDELMNYILHEAKKMEETKSIELEWIGLSPFLILAGLFFLIASICTERFL
ncbi:MAG: VWA domain-containing protein [Candidatus Schekmanbacteria bacterium]|nr:VWA domain-containing protein [Candidatus Schekmanbacteria bacterium]